MFADNLVGVMVLVVVVVEIPFRLVLFVPCDDKVLKDLVLRSKSMLPLPLPRPILFKLNFPSLLLFRACLFRVCECAGDDEGGAGDVMRGDGGSVDSM